MKIEGLRSSYEKVGGLVYFGRLVDKIRLNAQGKLPEGWATGPKVGFDRRCTSFLHVPYEALAGRVLQGGTDEEILEWCFREGRKPTAEETYVWNAFMMKRGWRDDGTEGLEAANARLGWATARIYRHTLISRMQMRDETEQPISANPAGCSGPRDDISLHNRARSTLRHRPASLTLLVPPARPDFRIDKS
jgi:gluconokinase